MRLFSCQKCEQTLFFENDQCTRCGSAVGFLSDTLQMTALLPVGEVWQTLVQHEHLSNRWRYCDNHQYGACNWLVADDGVRSLCIACSLNRHIPNLNDETQCRAWQALECAKHRLIYSLLRWGLPLINKQQHPEEGLAFDFISERAPVPLDAQATTGHVDGKVTISAAEADSVKREQQRQAMAEDYRTLIGHFRHEVGHYYWQLLLAGNNSQLEAFRACFGDERQDYQQALHRHYNNGPASDWRNQFISAYASSHPWEDWAETWAHYLHLVETLDTAQAFGVRLEPKPVYEGLMVQADIDPYQATDFNAIYQRSVPLTLAVNSLNRSMGQPDLYPFVLSDKVQEKLAFVHQVIADWRVAGSR